MSNLSDRYSDQGLNISSAQIQYLSSDGTTQTGVISGSDLSTAAAAGQPITITPGSVISQSDFIRLEVSDDGQEWLDSAAVFPDVTVGASVYGIRLEQNGANLDVTFGADGADSSTTWAALTPGTWAWRIRVASPNAPAGIQAASGTSPGVVLADKFQRKEIRAGNPGSTINDISELKFSGLEIGKVYRASIGAEFNVSGTSGLEEAVLKCTHDGNELCRVTSRSDSYAAADSRRTGAGSSSIFTATSTEVIFDLLIAGTAIAISGRTFSQLEELNNYIPGSW